MLRFIVKRLASAVLVMFTISVLVFLIFFATPGVDPAARIAGRSASPRRAARRSPRSSDLIDPLPIRYGLMMYHLFIKQDLTSYVNIGDKIIPQITAAAPITLSLIFGAVVIWLVVGICRRGHRGQEQGQVHRSVGHVLRHRRDLDPGVLARRDGLTRHPGRDCIDRSSRGCPTAATCR